MRRGWLIACVALGACGRVAFDSLDDAGDSAGGDASTPPYRRVAYLKSSELAAGDTFGSSVAISADGQTIAVGAPTQAADAGAVYVFRRSGDTWAEEAALHAMVSDPGDQFGWSVGLSDDGNTLVVGARREDSGTPTNPADNNATFSGAAYVFARVGATWMQTQYIKPPTIDAQDEFGERVAISGTGTTIAVGSTGEDSAAIGINGNQADDSASAAGAVWIFVGPPYAFNAYLKAPNADAGDAFGFRLALARDGADLVVGAYREDNSTTGINAMLTNDAAVDSGAIYVYGRDQLGWSLAVPIKASNTESGDGFGYGVAISPDGNVVLAAAQDESGPANSVLYSGAVYTYQRQPSWSDTGMVKGVAPSNGDELGYCLAISAANTFLAGAIFEDSSSAGLDGDPTDGMLSDSGAVYLYADNGAGWIASRYIKAPEPGPGDWFGFACDISDAGDTVVVSAPYEDGSGRFVNAPVDEDAPEAGAVYVWY